MIRFRLRGMLAIARREARMIRKDKNILLIIILAPLFYAFFYAAVYSGKIEPDPVLFLIDRDQSAFSRQLTRALDSHQFIRVVSMPDEETARAALENLEGYGILTLPENLGVDIKSGKRVTLSLWLNNAFFLISNDLNKAVNEVTGTAGSALRLQKFELRGQHRDQAARHLSPFSAQIHSLFNPVESYGNFMIPALFVLVLHQTLLIGLSESMADERVGRTLGDLYRLSGGSTWAIVWGKGVFYLALYLSYALFFFTAGFSVFGMTVKGSLPALLFLTFLLIFCVIYYGIFLASFFRRKIVALQVLALTSYPVFLTSGYSWPQESMPLWLQVLADLFPGTPFFQAFSRVVFMGAELRHIQSELIHLLILLAAGITATRLRLPRMARWQADHYPASQHHPESAGTPQGCQTAGHP